MEKPEETRPFHTVSQTHTQAASALREHSHEAYPEQCYTCLNWIRNAPIPQFPHSLVLFPSPSFPSCALLSKPGTTLSHQQSGPEVGSNLPTGCTKQAQQPELRAGLKFCLDWDTSTQVGLKILATCYWVSLHGKEHKGKTDFVMFVCGQNKRSAGAYQKPISCGVQSALHSNFMAVAQCLRITICS